MRLDGSMTVPVILDHYVRARLVKEEHFEAGREGQCGNELLHCRCMGDAFHVEETKNCEAAKYAAVPRDVYREDRQGLEFGAASVERLLGHLDGVVDHEVHVPRRDGQGL